MSVEKRSYEAMRIEDLEKLQRLALEERQSFFDRNPHLRETYWDSLIAIALCQGAALHFNDRKTGVKDFDIWYFYVKGDRVRYPYRARKHVDSGLAKFGVHPDDAKKGYKGRGVDLLGRGIIGDKRDPAGSVVQYLRTGRTETARKLAQKAVVGLWPRAILGQTIWPEARI